MTWEGVNKVDMSGFKWLVIGDNFRMKVETYWISQEIM